MTRIDVVIEALWGLPLVWLLYDGYRHRHTPRHTPRSRWERRP